MNYITNTLLLSIHPCELKNQDISLLRANSVHEHNLTIMKNVAT